MLRYLGYACIALDYPANSNRGTVLRLATPERLLALTGQNLAGLGELLQYNVRIGARLFRISSQVVPFGSHPANTTAWWEVFAEELAELGRVIRDHGLRVSMHPGQYTLLSAPDPSVLKASIRDLEYHARFLDALGLDGSHKLITHGGGLYGDPAAALQRWAVAYARLTENVRRRLVLENDERLYGAEDVLLLAERTGVPVCFDVFHHRVKVGSDADLGAWLIRAFATWNPAVDGPPKVHFSSQAAGQRPGAHADYVDLDEFQAFLTQAPRTTIFDCMLEAKAKDRAFLRLRDSLTLAEVGAEAG
jgi:UV DNA damage endonuclease